MNTDKINKFENIVFDYLEENYAKKGFYYWVARNPSPLPNLFRGDIRGMGKQPKWGIHTDFWKWENGKTKNRDRLMSNDIYFCIEDLSRGDVLKFKIYLRYCVGKFPKTKLGEARLKFVELIDQAVKKEIDGIKYSPEELPRIDAIDFKIHYPEEFDNVKDLLYAYGKTLVNFIEIIDEAIKETKKEFNKWETRRIYEVEYGKVLEQRRKNIDNYYKKQGVQNISISKQNTNMIKSNSKNIILYGPPGTGKTYYTIDRAVEIIKGNKCETHKDSQKELDELKKKGQIEFITFHQNYSYEDFVIGLKPAANKGTLTFEVSEGIFYKIAKQAKDAYNKNKNNPDKYVLIIDEINRANISRVFGELITLLEEDKRIGGDNELTVKLPHRTGDENFGVPPNLYILGTMNTADKSIALVDIALRRRFTFEGFYPSESLLEDLQNIGSLTEEAVIFLKHINAKIMEDKGPDYVIGHAYFIDKNFDDVIINKIIPLLNEYYPIKNTGKYIEKITDMVNCEVVNVEYDKNNYKWKMKP